MLQSAQQNSLDSLAERGKTLVRKISRSFARPEDAPQPSAWHSGMVIEPAEFSRQLVRLQFSLRGDKVPDPASGES